MKVKAKCPKCKNGCNECVDGYIDVEIPIDSPDVKWFTWHCNSCGFDNGMCMGTYIDSKDNQSGSNCVNCDSSDCEWLEV